MDDLGNVYFDKLVERLNLMANDLFSIRLSDKGLQDVAVVWKLIGKRRHRCH